MYLSFLLRPHVSQRPLHLLAMLLWLNIPLSSYAAPPVSPTTSIPAVERSLDEPYISPTFIYVNEEGVEETATEYTGSAPFTATLKANAHNTEGWTTHYEWRIMREGDDTPFLVRYEEDTEVEFRKAGSYSIYLYATFTQGKDTVAYTEEYWAYESPMRINIGESKLDMPNAFSPNNDGINDVYKAKEGYKSIVEFHAYIFNRWGQKVYEWTDPAGGWDGTFNGQEAKQGVYFVLVKAKGADGRTYNIRKDVNLLRGYTETTNRQ